MILACGLFISACSHTIKDADQTIHESNWKHGFVNYQKSLSDEEITKTGAILEINEEMRRDVIDRFGAMSKISAARALERWLVDPDGLGLDFVFDANLTPIQAYQYQQANCLTYSLLLSQLAAALDIKIHINSVDTPDTWSMENNTMFFYRHVNGIYKTPTLIQAFDFTPDSYDPRFPQRILSDDEALALFYSNRALDHYREKEFDNALHLIKIATSLGPRNPDIWANVGAILKANGDREKAKDALQYSLDIDSHHLVSVSQLERLYREDGDSLNAERYAKQANKSRNSNPYFLFIKSKQGFLDGEYSLAKQLISKAIRRHRYDPRFFALLAMIESKSDRYKAAQRNFKQASKLEKNQQQKLSYANKAQILGRAHRAQNRDTRPWVTTAPVSPSILGN